MDICFPGTKQFECNNYIIHSLNHDRYLQLLKISPPSHFDESNIKNIIIHGCYLINGCESKVKI